MYTLFSLKICRGGHVNGNAWQFYLDTALRSLWRWFWRGRWGHCDQSTDTRSILGALCDFSQQVFFILATVSSHFFLNWLVLGPRSFSFFFFTLLNPCVPAYPFRSLISHFRCSFTSRKCYGKFQWSMICVNKVQQHEESQISYFFHFLTLQKKGGVLKHKICEKGISDVMKDYHIPFWGYSDSHLVSVSLQT